MGRNAYSGFRVKHACGHIEYLEHLLPPQEEERYADWNAVLRARESKLEWLEQRPCQSCHYKDSAETQLDQLFRLGLMLPPLPSLKGTEKQRSWGRKIRSKQLSETVEAYRSFLRQLDQQQHHGSLNSTVATQRRQWCDRAISYVVIQDDAAWWIEHRSLPGWELVRKVARVVQGTLG